MVEPVMVEPVMVEPVMDEHELLQQLNHFYEVRLHLDEDKRELLLPRDQAHSLPETVTEAIKHHREALLKRTLFVDTLTRFDRWMSERGADGNNPAIARVAGRASLGAGGTAEYLNEIWDSADLSTFEEALSAYMRTGARAFLEELEPHSTPHQPTLTR